MGNSFAGAGALERCTTIFICFGSSEDCNWLFSPDLGLGLPGEIPLVAGDASVSLNLELSSADVLSLSIIDWRSRCASAFHAV